MVKCYVKADTVKEGIDISWVDSETNERTVEFQEFEDYIYVKEDAFYSIKEDLTLKWGKYIKKASLLKANNQNDKPDSFVKIILNDNFKKYFIKEWLNEKDIKHFEGDLDTAKRNLIDNYKDMELNMEESPYLFYDIETDDRKDFIYDEYGKIIPENSILSFAAYDNKGRSFFFINEDSENPDCEKELLLKITNLFKNYSVVSGWFSSGFDDVYLTGRCKVHGLQDVNKLVNNIDFMHSYEKYRVEISLDSYSLDNVSNIELGEKKIDIKKGGGRLYKLYLTDKEKLEKYNLKDAELLYNLNKKLKFMELHLQTAELGKCRVQMTAYNIGSNDCFILMKCRDRNLIAPSNPTKEEKAERYKLGGIGGGYTRGVPGLYEDVAVYDFSSLYPSLEITYNISPETFIQNATVESQAKYLENKDKDVEVFKTYDELKDYADKMGYIITPSDYTYVAKQGREIYHPYRLYNGEKLGLLPSVMVELIEKRYKVKESMKDMEKGSVEYDRAYNKQLALKYMLNSSYGLNALPGYRFYNFNVGDSITTSGRVNTKKIRRFAEENMFKVVYTDTDSVGIYSLANNKITFIEFDTMLADYINEMLSDTNNKVYSREDRGKTVHHRLILEWEKVYKTLLYKKKKRYVGLIDNPKGEDYIDIKGLKSTQMNVLAAKIQDEFMEDVIRKRFDKDKWKLKMNDWFEKCYSGKIEVENLIISKRFTARAAEQKAPRAHTLLAERMIEAGYDVAVGDKIKYIVEDIKPKQHAVTVEDFKTYPADYYWDIFTKPIITLLSVIDKDMPFEIIKMPKFNKLQEKLAKETDDEKKMKLMVRIDKHREKISDLTIDEKEKEDFLF